jgi:hypothetical protein
LEKCHAKSEKTPFEIAQPKAARARRAEAHKSDRLPELRIDAAAAPRLRKLRFLRRAHRDSERDVVHHSSFFTRYLSLVISHSLRINK